MTDWRQRYRTTYFANLRSQSPNFFEASGGESMIVNYPNVKTANGLTNAIIKFLEWSGHRATRINVSGRLIEKAERQQSGISLMTKKWLKSSTRKGTADISSTIKIGHIGMSVMWEIKVGKDKPSEYQLSEQQRERSAGGEYFFIHTIEEFFAIYDSLIILH